MAIVFLGVGLMGFGMGFRSNMYFSMLADVAVMENGRAEGILQEHRWQSMDFPIKFPVHVLSAIVAGLLHGELMTERWQCSHQKRIWQFYLHLLFLPIIANIVSIVVMYFYDLDKQYDQMERELKERRKKLAEQTAE